MNKQRTAEAFTPTDHRIRLRLGGPSRPFDARQTAIRKDLADVAAADQFFAPHYAAAVRHACVDRSAIVRGTPDDAASATTQILHGEAFHILDVRAGWAWGYCGHDHYVGYVPRAALSPAPVSTATHRIVPEGGLLFARPDIKSPVVTPLPGSALIHVEAEDGDFLGTGEGWLHRRHAASIADKATDWVAVARHWLGMPYLWGGRGDGGLDCSGLVQQALAQCGIAAARDTDQQAGSIGRALGNDEPLAKGDIVFFPGHVGIMSDADTLLHANAYWMKVVEEPLADVVARLISAHAEPITARRRIEA